MVLQKNDLSDQIAGRHHSMWLRFGNFSLATNPGHWSCALVLKEERLKRLKIQTALFHQLLPAYGFRDVRINPDAQFFELRLLRFGAALAISDQTHRRNVCQLVRSDITAWYGRDNGDQAPKFSSVNSSSMRSLFNAAISAYCTAWS